MLNKKSTSQYIIACVTAGPDYLKQAEQTSRRKNQQTNTYLNGQVGDESF